jgi:cysteine desulfurase/selenocysteine lyase
MTPADLDQTPLDRRLFGVTRSHCYLNHAGIGPLPRPAVAAMSEAAEDVWERGGPALDDQADRAEVVRQVAAELMGVTSEEVAFVKNTTEGLSFVAEGLDLPAGSRVVVADREFPSTIYPFIHLRSRGVTVDLVAPAGPGGSLEVSQFTEVMDSGPPVSLVVVSWVQFSRGYRSDLTKLAEAVHARGALLCVDMIQGLGVVPANLAAAGVDFGVADSHKWMLGPSGIGVMSVAEAVKDRLRPVEPGWASVAHREDWDNLSLIFDPTARRYEGGSNNLTGTLAMGAAIEMLLSAGIDRIFRHVQRWLRAAEPQLEKLGFEILADPRPEHRAGILTVSHPEHNPADLVGALDQQGVIVSARGGGIRLSPHGYNNQADLDRLIAVLSDALAH